MEQSQKPQVNLQRIECTAFKYKAGVDEVGRGPLAGPVVAAIVILNPKHRIVGLNDSKKLTPKIREQLSQHILESALDYAFGRAEVFEIDKINIFRASLLAMQRAIEKLKIKPRKILFDGTHYPPNPYPSRAIIKGDETEPEISAASIIAKVARDYEMVLLDKQYPGYGFAQHKGYGTKEHMAALSKLGPCEIHRRSFAPIKNSIVEVA